MIRINLLPGKKAKRAEATQRHLLAMGGAVLMGLGAAVFVHIQGTGHRDELQRQNSIVQADIERLKAEMGDYDKIKGQREDLMKQRTTIQALETKRTGPVFLLRELSEILSPGKGPTFDRLEYEERLRRDPNAGFNASWDTKRVWIESFEEEGKKVKIKALAKSVEDVAEFSKRLMTSVFFSDVNTPSAAQVTGTPGAATVKHISFNLEAGASY